MDTINYSALLRALVDRHFDNRIGRVEYAAQRRCLLERIDREFNGGAPASAVTRPAWDGALIAAPADPGK